MERVAIMLIERGGNRRAWQADGQARGAAAYWQIPNAAIAVAEY